MLKLHFEILYTYVHSLAKISQKKALLIKTKYQKKNFQHEIKIFNAYHPYWNTNVSYYYILIYFNKNILFICRTKSFKSSNTIELQSIPN